MRKRRFVLLMLFIPILLAFSACDNADPDDGGASGSVGISIEEEYQLVAEMAELTYESMTVQEFNAAIQALCDEAGVGLLSVYADVRDIIAQDDELYAFVNGPLNHSCSEIQARESSSGAGKPNDLCVAQKARYENMPEDFVEPSREDMTEDEWLAWKSRLESHEFSIAFMASAHYTIIYDIPDNSTLTVAEREQILNTYRTEMQQFIEGMSEDTLKTDAAEPMFKAALDQASSRFSSDKIRVGCDFHYIERIGDEIIDDAIVYGYGE